MDALLFLLGGAGAIVVVSFITTIVLYILSAIGYTYVLSELGAEQTWAAWIPVYNNIVLTAYCKSDENGTITIFGQELPLSIFKWWPLATFALSFVPIVGWLADLICTIACLGAVLKIVYARMDNTDERSISFIAYASTIVGLIITIKFLLYKNRGNTPSVIEAIEMDNYYYY